MKQLEYKIYYTRDACYEWNFHRNAELCQNIMTKIEVFHAIKFPYSFLKFHLLIFQIGFYTERDLETRSVAEVERVLQSLKHHPNFQHKNIR